MEYSVVKGVFLGIIAVAYIIIGIIVIIKKWFLVIIDPAPAYGLGSILMLFGLYRLYRAVQSAKEKGSL